MRRATSRGKKILLVEDEGDLAAVLSEVLRRDGYEVVLATSSAEALEMFRRDTLAIDLLITDITLHGLNGVTLAKKIVERRPIAVLFMSGVLIEDVAEVGSAREFLQKPFSMEQLLQIVGKLIQQDE